jgi:hypothetical protein
LRDAGFDVVDDVSQVFDLAENYIYLIKDIPAPLRWHEPAAAPVEELYAQRLLGVLHQSADPGRGHIEQSRCAGQRSRNHDRANDLDLAEGQHRKTFVQRTKADQSSGMNCAVVFVENLQNISICAKSIGAANAEISRTGQSREA